MQKLFVSMLASGLAAGWASSAAGHDGGWGATRGLAQHLLRDDPLTPRGDLEGVVIVVRRAACVGDFHSLNWVRNNQRYFNHLFCTVTDTRGRTWKLTFHATGETAWQYSNLHRVGGGATASGAVSGGFMSPSGNIRCRYFSSTSTVGCLTRNDGVETLMSLYGRPYAQPVSHLFPAGPVLAYGASINLGGEFRCSSRTTGMFCRSLGSGRCFLTAREGRSFACASSSNPPPPTPPPSAGCDPSYPDFCIPPPPPDLDCADIPRTDFTVRGSDPHGFDGDRDGVGCES